MAIGGVNHNSVYVIEWMVKNFQLAGSVSCAVQVGKIFRKPGPGNPIIGGFQYSPAMIRSAGSGGGISQSFSSSCIPGIFKTCTRVLRQSRKVMDIIFGAYPQPVEASVGRAENSPAHGSG